MRILSIDASCKTAMAAVSEEGVLSAAVSVSDCKTHSVKLLPAIEYVLNVSDTEKSNICAVAVTNGPGSYTGLRIGVATAKTYAYALGVPLIGLNTLEALSFSVCAGREALVCPLIDARNGRVYAALYKNRSEIIPASPISCEELCGELKSRYNEREIIFTGDGVKPNADILKKYLGEMFIEVPEALAAGTPAALAGLAYEKYIAAVSDGSIKNMTAAGLRVEYYKKYTDEI